MKNLYKSQRTRKLQALRKKGDQLEERLFEAYVEGKTQDASHSRLQRRHQEKLESVRMKLAALESGKTGLADHLNFAARLLSNLREVYHTTDAEGKYRLRPVEYPRQESNLRTRLRRPVLCPLSYGG